MVTRIFLHNEEELKSALLITYRFNTASLLNPFLLLSSFSLRIGSCGLVSFRVNSGLHQYFWWIFKKRKYVRFREG